MKEASGMTQVKWLVYAPICERTRNRYQRLRVKGSRFAEFATEETLDEVISRAMKTSDAVSAVQVHDAASLVFYVHHGLIAVSVDSMRAGEAG